MVPEKRLAGSPAVTSLGYEFPVWVEMMPSESDSAIEPAWQVFGVW